MNTAFQTWMRKVDDVLLDAVGVTADDCRDRCWRALFENGVGPREVVEIEFGDLDDPESMMLEELFG